VSDADRRSADAPPRPDTLAAVAERDRPLARPDQGFADTLSLAFADPDAACLGVVVFELTAGSPPAGAAAVLLWADGELVLRHERDELRPAAPTWSALATETVTIDTGSEAWHVSIAGDELGVELDFVPVGEAFGFGADDPPASLSGLQRSERLCRVHGSATIAGKLRELHGHGQRSHQWGRDPWRRIGASRTLGAWFDDGGALALWSVRPSGGAPHDRDALAARAIEGDPPLTLGVADPRLSATYSASGALRRVGLELWLGPDDPFPRRAAAELICAGAVTLHGVHQSWSWLDWRIEGHAGVGPVAIAAAAGSAPPER
jgi:hypothetical protein